MGILEVRLCDEDEDAVRELLGRGVSISTFVREAIRAEALKASTTDVHDVHSVIGEMLKLFPGDADRDVRTSVAVDRRKAQDAIQARLQKPR